MITSPSVIQPRGESRALLISLTPLAPSVAPAINLPDCDSITISRTGELITVLTFNYRGFKLQLPDELMDFAPQRLQPPQGCLDPTVYSGIANNGSFRSQLVCTLKNKNTAVYPELVNMPVAILLGEQSLEPASRSQIVTFYRCTHLYLQGTGAVV